jgi:hypothetical protein
MRDITFIVGAGASTEFGLPTGKRLLEIISQMANMNFNGVTSTYAIDNDLKIFLEGLAGKDNHLGSSEHRFMTLNDEAVWLSKVALMAPSIDNLLHSHKDNPIIEQIGKSFICKAIMHAESNSFLANILRPSGYSSHFELMQVVNGERQYISDKWIGKLFSLLVEMRDFDAFLLILDRLNFICFNYDRCIEQAITSLAMRYYKLDSTQGQKVLDKLRVTHVYGSLGSLTVLEGLVYGYGNPALGLSTLVQGIETFTKQTAVAEVRDKIKEALQNSDLAIFLGYGFLEINNRLLFENGPFNLRRVFATAKGLSEASVSTISFEMEQAFLFGSDGLEARAAKLSGGRPDKVTLSDHRCAELLDHHGLFIRRALAA